MKAAQNGVPNISVLDGWWDEGYDRRQRLGDRRPRDRTPTRPPRTGPTPRTCTGSSRRRSCPRYYERDDGGHPDRAGSRSCAGRWRRRCGASRRPGCSRSTPSGSTCRRPASTVPVAGPRRRSSPRPADRAVAAAHLAGARAPQPPAGRQLRLGLRRGLRPGLPADDRGARAPSRRPAVAPLHRSAARVAASPSGPTFVDRLRALVDARPGRDPGRRLLRAGPRLAAGARPDRPAAADGATSSSALFGRRPTRRLARGARLGAGPADVARRRAATRWTILDDAHFRAAAIPEEDLWGPYTTEDQGHLLRVFGTEQGLRYRIPFREVDEVIDYLRDHATEDGDAGRDDGRRRREVRGVADDLGALLGRAAAGSSGSSRRSRRTPTG